MRERPDGLTRATAPTEWDRRPLLRWTEPVHHTGDERNAAECTVRSLSKAKLTAKLTGIIYQCDVPAKQVRLTSR